MNRMMFLRSGFAMLALAVPAACGGVIGWDNADNDPYDSENTFMEGQNGGNGFQPWVNLAGGTPGAMYLAEPSLRDEGLNSWGLSGTYAVGRGLTEAVTAGTWTFLASHGAGIGSFCGFNLRTSTNAGTFSDDEIFRFGVDYSQEGDTTRIYYSTNGGGDYGYLDLGEDSLLNVTLQYSVTWSTLSGTFTLAVLDLDASLYGEISGWLPAGAPVAMLGAGIFEATLDEKMKFDDYGVAAVPEPAAAVLLCWGAFGLWAGRGRRCRRP